MKSLIEHAPNLTRRRFLAGSAAAVAATGFMPARSWARGNRSDCAVCPDDPVLKFAGAVRAGGSYLAAVVLGERFGIYQLRVDRTGKVGLGRRLPVRVPDELIWGELAVVGDHLLLVGGRPFEWRTEEIDYEQPPAIAQSMETMPDHVPTSGKQTVTTWGIEPAAYVIDSGELTPFDLPETSRRLMGFAASAVEGESGGPAILIAHSEDRAEGSYASGVEVWEQANGTWTLAEDVAGLGESGPYLLALEDGVLTAVVNSGDGSSSVYRRRTRSQVPFSQGAVRAAAANGRRGLTVYATAPDGTLRRWSRSRPGGPWADDGVAAVEGELAVDAVAVGGTHAETLVVGTSSAWMTHEA